MGKITDEYPSATTGHERHIWASTQGIPNNIIIHIKAAEPDLKLGIAVTYEQVRQSAEQLLKAVDHESEQYQTQRQAMLKLAELLENAQ